MTSDSKVWSSYRLQQFQHLYLHFQSNFNLSINKSSIYLNFSVSKIFVFSSVSVICKIDGRITWTIWFGKNDTSEFMKLEKKMRKCSVIFRGDFWIFIYKQVEVSHAKMQIYGDVLVFSFLLGLTFRISRKFKTIFLSDSKQFNHVIKCNFLYLGSLKRRLTRSVWNFFLMLTPSGKLLEESPKHWLKCGRYHRFSDSKTV